MSDVIPPKSRETYHRCGMLCDDPTELADVELALQRNYALRNGGSIVALALKESCLDTIAELEYKKQRILKRQSHK